MQPYKIKAFTLVELIVVITILTILGTIAFISLQGFARDARDSQRLSDIRTIQKGLYIQRTRGNTLPLPDNMVTITASGTIISYQGNIGTGVLIDISQAGAIVDPLLKVPYTYAITSDRKNIQILGYFEINQLAFLNPNNNFLGIKKTHAAATYSELYPKSFGDKVGVLTSTGSNIPIQNQAFPGNTLDILNMPVNGYKAYVGDTIMDGISGTFLTLLSNQSCKRILDLLNSNGDGIYTINPTGLSEVEVYCDVTTDGGGWTFFGFIDSSGSIGSNFFGGGEGLYDSNKIDNGTVYSLGTTMFYDTEMMTILDEDDANLDNSKIVFHRYETGNVGFNAGPLPCSGLGGTFEYKITAGGEYSIGGPSNILCNSQYWTTYANNAHLLLLTSHGGSGVYWGSGMGGNNGRGHSGWWYLR